MGLQPLAAEYGGVNVGACWWRAMALSGALAGLGGLNFVLGYKHYYEEGFAGGAGFLGIAVALVGRNHPVGVVLAALLFATLSQGGLAINALVPKQIVDVLQAVVILAVAASVPEVRRLAARAGDDRARLPGADAAHRDSIPVRRGRRRDVRARRRDRPHARGLHARRRVLRGARQLLQRAARGWACWPGAAGGVAMALLYAVARFGSAPIRSWSASRSTCWSSG